MRSAKPRPKSAKKIPKQLALELRSHGGARRGAGRKRRSSRARVVHRTRPRIDRNHPVHVTVRIRAGVPRLRTRAPMRTILRVLRAARGRFDLRVIQFAVLGDHLHMLVEAEGCESLTRGMRGLGTRLAIHLNRTFSRRGRLLDDRYHARALATPLEVRRGLCYVLQNFRKHAAQRGQKVAARWIDPCSSGGIFDGWRDFDPRRIVFEHDLGTLAPRTWLLAIGWRRHGRIGTDEIPGATSPPSAVAVRECDRRAA